LQTSHPFSSFLLLHCTQQEQFVKVDRSCGQEEKHPI